MSWDTAFKSAVSHGVTPVNVVFLHRTRDITALHTATNLCCCRDLRNNMGAAALHNATTKVMRHLIVQNYIALLQFLLRGCCVVRPDNSTRSCAGQVQNEDRFERPKIGREDLIEQVWHCLSCNVLILSHLGAKYKQQIMRQYHYLKNLHSLRSKTYARGLPERPALFTEHTFFNSQMFFEISK